MNFEERDKPLIKDINSNIIRAGLTELNPSSKIYFLTNVVNDAMVFSIILKNRNDYKHSLEYIKTSINANKEIKAVLKSIFEDIKKKNESNKRS